MGTRPNILLVMADQLNPGFLPVYGHPLVQAPHLASLAARGTVFTKAYCNYPICAPSRYSMLTGRLPHTIGAWDNAAEFAAETPTLAHRLRRLGYRTTLCGKMHFVGPDQLHGYDERLITDIYPADFAWVPDWAEGPRNAPTGISMRAVVEAGHCLRSLQIDYDDETEHLALQKLHDLARRPAKEPFFLTVSFSHPHSPFTAPKAHWDRYRHDDIEMPAVGPLSYDALDTHSRWLYLSHGRDRLAVTDAHIRNARHAYYGMISYVDDKLGQLLGALHDLGMADDTLVVFTSDHGEMLGERGMWYKQCFFEGSARVPLVIAGAGWSGPSRSDTLVSLVDLMPTLLETAGEPQADADARAAGTSLHAVTAGAGAERAVFSEYSDMGVCAPCRMVRLGRHKLIVTHGHLHQLYDLEADPLELANLAGNPAHAPIEARLLERAFAGWDPDLLEARIRQSQRDRQLIYGVTRKDPPARNWSWVVRPDDARRFVRGGGDAEGTVATKGRARFPYVPPASTDR